MRESESESESEEESTSGHRTATKPAARKRARTAKSSTTRGTPRHSPAKSILQDLDYGQDCPHSSSCFGNDEGPDPRGSRELRSGDGGDNSSSGSFTPDPDQQQQQEEEEEEDDDDDDDDDESYTETRRAAGTKKQRGAATANKLATPRSSQRKTAVASSRKPNNMSKPSGTSSRASSAKESANGGKNKAVSTTLMSKIKSPAPKSNVDVGLYDLDGVEVDEDDMMGYRKPAPLSPPAATAGSNDKTVSATKALSKNTNSSSPKRKAEAKSVATAKAASFRELDVRLPPSNKLPLECGVLMHLTAPAPVASNVGAEPSRGGRDIKAKGSVARAKAGGGSAKNVSHGVSSSSGSVLELDGATGAVGRLEVDGQGVVLDLKGTQFRGTLFPCATAMVLTVITKKGEDIPHMRLEGITDEFCRLIPTGQSALDQMNATTTVHGMDPHPIGQLDGSFTADDLYYDEKLGMGSTDPPKAPPTHRSASRSRKR